MATMASTNSQASIHPQTRMGAVALTVSDLARSRAFYEQALGLVASEREDGGLALAPTGGATLIELVGEASAAPLDRQKTGLYHLAVLVPSRLDLAFALARLLAIRWPLDGASDHLVSEALYLSDPDGNGIEIYRDRPREDWPRNHGQLAMDTLPLDLDNVLAELSGAAGLQRLAPEQTTIGHVHLQVADLRQAEDFYRGVLGFEVTVRGYPGALFVSAGGYHHHLGLNTWHSAGAGPPAAGTVGLRNFEILLPDRAELERLRRRIADAGIELQASDRHTLVRDPSDIQLALRAA